MTQGEPRAPADADRHPRSAERRRPEVAARAACLAAVLVVVLAQSGCAVVAGVGAAGALAGGAVGALVGSSGGGGGAPYGGVVGAAVAVDIDPPRDLALVRAAPDDTAWVRGVRFLLGRVTAVRSDTLWLAVTEARGSAGPSTFPALAGPVTSVVGGPGVAVRVVARDAGRATTAYVGAALGAAAAILGLYYWCGQTRCLD